MKSRQRYRLLPPWHRRAAFCVSRRHRLFRVDGGGSSPSSPRSGREIFWGLSFLRVFPFVLGGWARRSGGGLSSFKPQRKRNRKYERKRRPRGPMVRRIARSQKKEVSKIESPTASTANDDCRQREFCGDPSKSRRDNERSVLAVRAQRHPNRPRKKLRGT